ncbi:MAG: glycosyltransferase family 1 protein [Leifsonia sp.]
MERSNVDLRDGQGWRRMRRVVQLIRVVVQSIRHDGMRVFLGKALRKMGAIVAGEDKVWLISRDDAAVVDWTEPPANHSTPVVVKSGPIEIAWISSPPGRESGGHQNLFRFIKFAEQAGHRSTIYIYDQFSHSLRHTRSMVDMSNAYPDLAAHIVDYDAAVGVAPTTQAIFASGWETAYPAYRDASSARRFYFVQDFEPGFYPIGSEYVLAENTYRFGFHGITAGGWLARKLHDDYGMRTDHFDFSIDPSLYNLTNRTPRNEVFFYARPVTPRRAFELGMLALKDFHELMPEVTINLAGGNLAHWNVPFPHNDLAALDVSKLNELYNRCAAGLVLSLTNMSLLPLELMASGAVPVVNDGPNNREVSDHPYIEWAAMSPPAIARKLVEVMQRPDAVDRSITMAESLVGQNWETSGKQFLAALEKGMRG